MNQTRRGYLFGIGAFLCWGLFPLYWKLLRPAGALEILAHRIVWSFVLLAVVVSFARQWQRVIAMLKRPRDLGLIIAAAAIISANWGLYIYGVNASRIVETSLGYFINPLVTVLLGVLVLHERLRPWQWAAIGVGATAVVVLTIDYGHVPYIALALAFSFAGYGLIKKRLAVPAIDGLLIESGVLTIPAIAFVIALAARPQNHFGSGSPILTALFVLAGAVSVVPLLLFAGAANRIPLSSIGLLQYIGPTLQLGCGVLIFSEPMPPGRLTGFALVWIALAIFTWDAAAHVRDTRKGSAADPQRLAVNA